MAPTPYHALAPLTKAAFAATAALGSFLVGGFVVPLALWAFLVVPGAIVARLLRRVLRIAVLVSLPIAISVALVSVFTRPGSTVVFVIGPFEATVEGAVFAAEVAVRVVVGAAALVLLGLTTRPADLLVDLESRGLSPRLSFAAVATLEALPAAVERGRAIRDAQRARGLDTEGSLARRLRGVLPLAAPVIASSLVEVEARSLALDARAFGARRRRHLLWVPADSSAQRFARGAAAILLVALVAARIAGLLAAVP